MPYRITRHADDLIWVVMEGHLTLAHAEVYFHELWGLLDRCPHPTDLLLDGRAFGGASSSVRRRTDQIAHHPHLGHLAFVVGEAHLLLFAPFVKLVSGIGMFGSEHEAIDYLRAARGLPPVADLELPIAPPAPPPPAARVATNGRRLRAGSGYGNGYNGGAWSGYGDGLNEGAGRFHPSEAWSGYGDGPADERERSHTRGVPDRGEHVPPTEADRAATPARPERPSYGPARPLPPPPTSRVPARFHQAAARPEPPAPPPHHPEPPRRPDPPRLPTLNDLVHGLARGINSVARRIEGED